MNRIDVGDAVSFVSGGIVFAVREVCGDTAVISWFHDGRQFCDVSPVACLRKMQRVSVSKQKE